MAILPMLSLLTWNKCLLRVSARLQSSCSKQVFCICYLTLGMIHWWYSRIKTFYSR